MKIALGLLALSVLLLWEARRNRQSVRLSYLGDALVELVADFEAFARATLRAGEVMRAFSAGLVSSNEVRSQHMEWPIRSLPRPDDRVELIVRSLYGGGVVRAERELSSLVDRQVVTFDDEDVGLDQCFRCGSEIPREDELGLCDRCKTFLRSL